jgi:methylated-DNA-protein-cysteine methyltransferase-like protein
MAHSTRPRRRPAVNTDPGAGDADAQPAGYRVIWAAVAALERGQVAAYGEIARRAGLPRRARLVAQALRAAPAELALPWHRVIRADGRIAFEPDSDGFRRQRRLLRAEGATVADNGRVTPARRRPAQAADLDAALWAP